MTFTPPRGGVEEACAPDACLASPDGARNASMHEPERQCDERLLKASCRLW